MRLGLVLIALALPGCTFFMPQPACPPPPSVREPSTLTFSCCQPTVIPITPEPSCSLNLSALIALALENSPTTRQAWLHAKAAAANVGAARGSYLPPIIFTTEWTKEQFLIVGEPGYTLPTAKQSNTDITLSTNYLLFDFGGRNGNLSMALSALSAMNWQYNWEVQTVMINVIQSYYNYINAVERHQADLSNLEDSKTAFEAAETLTKHGCKNRSDALQAQTSFLQAEVSLEQSKGAVNVALATLVQSLGLSPDTPISICPLPNSLPIEAVCLDIERILESAKKNRADLAAERERVLENRAKIQIARSAFFPNLTANVVGGKGWINGRGPRNEYSLSFSVNYPLFNSFFDINALRKAQAELQIAQAQLDNDELAVFLAVLTDYYEFIANKEILKYSEKYLEVAIENQKVIYANYITGISTIIDLMSANYSLNQARVQLADAKTNFLTSLANLAYDTGSLQVYEE